MQGVGEPARSAHFRNWKAQQTFNRIYQWQWIAAVSESGLLKDL
jgi:hypothetical protein